MTPSEKEIQVKEDENTSIKNHLLVPPYQGEKGIHIDNSMKRHVNKILSKNVNVQTAFTGKRLSSCFKTKDKTSTRYNISSEVFCRKSFGWQYWRISKTCNHCGRDTKSYILKQSSEKEHVEVALEYFKIMGSHFKNNRLKRKIAEALLIKRERPSLNVQDQSVEPKLLN